MACDLLAGANSSVSAKDAFALNSFPEEKSSAEKASKKIELEVNPNSIFDCVYLIPLELNRECDIIFVLGY